MNEIEGFLTEENRELLLVGHHNPELPAIDLDDLVVALRNAFKVGPEYEAPIGVTIDPQPDAADPWRIQRARVFGMPPTAPMGERHLAIDYELKRVSAGLVSLKAGVPSVFDITRVSSPPCGGDRSEKALSTTHRFWFCPLRPSERPRFLDDDKGLWIRKPINVQLLSEEEFLSSGKRVGSAPPQPAAVEFTVAITRLLATNEVREYTQLRGDFRLIELAKLLEYKEAPVEAYQYFLHDCPLREMPVHSVVGGIRRTESGEAVCEARATEDKASGQMPVEISEKISRYSSEFRGGVEANVSLAEEEFSPPHERELRELRRRVRISRPSQEDIVWEIRV